MKFNFQIFNFKPPKAGIEVEVEIEIEIEVEVEVEVEVFILYSLNEIACSEKIGGLYSLFVSE